MAILLYAFDDLPNTGESTKKPSTATNPPRDDSSAIEVLKKWEMPATLKGISGIDFIDKNHLACISNETGSIIIYNIASTEIEATVPFAPMGDYEAIAIVGETAYIGCADGRLYEVAAYRSEQPVIKEYGTHLTVKQSVEGLCYDRKNNRLLVAIKGKEPGSPFHKGIYSFDLTTKKMAVTPVFRINLQDPVFPKQPVRNLQYVIQPSEIAIANESGDMYITDGTRSQLLILNANGEVKRLYTLDKSDFSQPDGISLTPSGEIFICNAGVKELPGTLVHLAIKD